MVGDNKGILLKSGTNELEIILFELEKKCAIAFDKY